MDLLRYGQVKRTIGILIFLLFGFASTALAKKIPITFEDFHGYKDVVNYVKKTAKSNPNIVELMKIGTSEMGRPIYVLVITNKKTGATLDKYVELLNKRKENIRNVTPMEKHQGKPGQWIDGGMHGNGYTGVEACLYIIDKLVSGYDNDSEIKDLIDHNVFYICPMVNPDGVYNSVDGGIPQVENSMKRDDDEDGKVNEDGPDDLNRDGHITKFRYKDPEGEYVIDDVDPRLMVKLGKDEETEKELLAKTRGIIRKPYELSKLLGAVREALTPASSQSSFSYESIA